MTDRERAVAAAMHEVAAARKRMPPYGGQSDDEDLPDGWPKAPPSFWFRRHDEFDDPPSSVTGAADAQDST